MKKDKEKILEHVLNEHVTLKLVKGKTTVHVDGEKFWTCASLVFSIPASEVEKFDEIESIDQAMGVLPHDEGNINISPEEEFWGHCSNLQAWIEYDYDSRLIDSRIGFPLLFRLGEIGDERAKRKFKEECAKRFQSGWLPTIEYLWRDVYLSRFDEEEQEVLLDVIKKAFIKAIKEESPNNSNNNNNMKILLRGGYLYLLNDEEKKGLDVIQVLRKDCLKILKDQREFRTHEEVVTLKEEFYEPEEFKERVKKWKERFATEPRELTLEKTVKYLILKGYFGALTAEDVVSHPKLQQLERLYLDQFCSPFTLKVLPDTIGKLKSLKELRVIRYDLITLPESLFELEKLQTLFLFKNKLKSIPESIGKLKNLLSLSLKSNNLIALPKSFGKLKKLSDLDISGNKLTTLPTSFSQLKFLKNLFMNINNFSQLPESLFTLSHLERLECKSMLLPSLPEAIGNLINLTSLDLSGNRFTSLPESIGNLSRLTELILSSNQLTTLPESIGNLKSLKLIRLYLNPIKSFPRSIENLQSLTALGFGNRTPKERIVYSSHDGSIFERLKEDGYVS